MASQSLGAGCDLWDHCPVDGGPPPRAARLHVSIPVSRIRIALRPALRGGWLANLVWRSPDPRTLASCLSRVRLLGRDVGIASQSLGDAIDGDRRNRWMGGGPAARRRTKAQAAPPPSGRNATSIEQLGHSTLVAGLPSSQVARSLPLGRLDRLLRRDPGDRLLKLPSASSRVLAWKAPAPPIYGTHVSIIRARLILTKTPAAIRIDDC